MTKLNFMIAAAIALGSAPALATAVAAAPAKPAAQPARPAAQSLTKAALTKQLDATFKAVDDNGDGTLTSQEIGAAELKVLQQRAGMVRTRLNAEFTKLDTNKDGQLSKAEFMAAAPAGPTSAPNGAPALAQLDKNKDGKVSLDEYRAPRLTVFDKADTNHDGTISAAEQQALAKSRRERRAAGQGPGASTLPPEKTDPMTADAGQGHVRRLFATPVVLDRLQGADALNAALERTIAERRGADSGLKLSNRGGWQSQHDFTAWAGAEGQALIVRAVELAGAHTQSPGGGPPRWRVDAWANVSGEGAFNMPHVHGGTFWSCVYYVRVGEGEGGQLVLHDPRMPGLRMHAPGVRFRNMGPELRAEIQPAAGLMVLFPGWLSHSVEPWQGTGERISVAMNIRAAG